MKRCLLLYFILVAFTATAQNTVSKNSLDLFIGIALPTGEFSAKDAFNNTSGLANTGPRFGVTYNHSIKRRWGLAAAADAQRNGIDKDALANSFNSGIYRNWMFDNSAWLLGSVRAGVYIESSTVSGSHFSCYGKVLAGLAYASSPKTNGNSKDIFGEAHIDQQSVGATGFAYSINAGLRYTLNSKISLLTNAGYLATNQMKFRNIRTNYAAVQYSSGAPISAMQQSFLVQAEQKFSLVNVNVGMGLKL